MATNSNSRFPIEVLILILVTMAALCVTLTVVGPELLPQLLQPTRPVAPQPTLPPTDSYSPEVIPAPTDMPDTERLSIRVPTDSPTPTLPPTFVPTATFSTGPLPDLTVTGISDPVCVENHIGSKTGKFLRFTIYVRNIGRVPTRTFGPFDVHLSVILGQAYYGLDEWAAKFDGVVGNSNLTISNLNPNADISLKLEIDLKGNTKFGLQAIANSGVQPIPDADTTNNTLIKYFSIYCY